MFCRMFGVAGVAVMILPSCAIVQSHSKVNEAMDLVAQRVGQRPEWTAPWDDQPPPWDEQTVLGVQEAAALALRNNRELRADLEMIGQANADLVQAGLLQNPTFNFMIMFPDGGGRSMLRSNALPMQPLQELWLIPARQSVATARLQEAVLRVADRAVETAAAVKKVYARLQCTQRAIELVKDNMAVVDQSTRIIRVRQSAGQATQVQVNLSQIRYIRLQSELIAKEAEHRSLQRELLMLTGLATATDQWKVEAVHEMKSPAEAPAGEPDALAVAMDQRLDLKAAEWNLQSAERAIELIRREGWPEVALAFTLERAPAPRAQGQKLAGRLGNAAAQGVASGITGMPPSGPMVAPFSPTVRDVTTMVGPMIEMEIPIFDQNQAQVAKAIHEYRQRLAEYESRSQEIARGVRETLVMYRQAHDQVRFYRDSIMPAVERNLTLARQSYVAGQEDLTVYLQVQEDLLMTRLKILEFFRDWLVNRAELERQVGGRLDLREPTTRPAATQPAL